MGRKAKNAHRLLIILYRNPMVNTSMIMKELDISQVTADKLIKSFQEVKILEEVTGFRRNRLFQFRGYFDLFMK